jgi:hypothetical protein
MDGEVAVLGSLNYLDIWNHERFLGRMKDQPFTDDDNRVLAQLGI